MIRLEKNQSTKIDLTKREAHGNIRINLNWSRGKKGLLGSLFGGATDVDLDLGALYELKNGQKGAIQALGKSFGQLTDAPFIQLAGDDRTGESQDGEWMSINGAHWDQIQRVLVYAFIYEGVPNWAATNGVLTVHPAQGAPITIPLAGDGTQAGFCIGALIENEGGQMKITRIDRYVGGHREADQAFGWGMRWTTGSK